MPRRFSILIAVSIIVLAADQITKYMVASRFHLYESVTLIENFFNLTYVRNKGAAFGMFADSAIRVPFFITVSVLAAVGILWYFYRARHLQALAVFALSLIFSGAVGNLIDRIRFGEVVDFLDVHWYGHHWPAFNVADSAITVGVALLLLDIWSEERQKKKAD